MSKPFDVHAGLSRLAQRYDLFLCDLWGVIHDGQQAYDGVLDALRMLQTQQITTVFLSNVPRAHGNALGVVERVGIPRDAYTDLVTSADAARHALQTRPDAFHQSLGMNYYHLGGGRYGKTLEGLAGYQEVHNLAEADFILNCGPDFNEGPNDYMALFAEAIELKLPMVGVNPDRRVMHGDSFEYCAGSLCALYDEMGGRMVEHGKPYETIYELAKALHPEVPADRILMIGDTLHTDIDGAHNAGLQAALVTHGIHAADLGVPLGGAQVAERAKLQALFDKEGTTPEHVLPAFIWS